MSLRRLFLALTICLVPWLAWAQGSGVVLQSGSVTPQHASRWVTNGVVGDAGGAGGFDIPGGNYLTELGITNTGTPFCINDNLTSNTSGYHSFCLGADALGGGLISYTANGGATELPVNCLINGTLVPNCLNGGGSGCVVNDVAGGTGDAITIPALPCDPTKTALTLTITASNATTTPTLTPVGGVPQVILAGDGTPLCIGDLVPGIHLLLTNNGVNWIAPIASHTVGPAVAGPTISTLGRVPGWGNTTGTLLTDTPSALFLNNTDIISGAAGPLNSSIWDVATPSGTANIGTVLQLVQGYVQPKNYFSCPIDTVNAADISGNPVDVPCIAVNEVIGGGSQIGSRNGITVNLNVSGASGNSGLNNFYSGILSTVAATASQGTNTGNLYGLTSQVTAYAGATGYGTVAGAEIDIGMQAGASATLKWGLLVLGGFNEGSGGAHGTDGDVGIWLNTQTSQNFNYGFEVGDNTPGHWPILNNGTIFGVSLAQTTAQAQFGIDFGTVTFSGCAFRSKTTCITDQSGFGLFTNDNGATQAGFNFNNGGMGPLLEIANFTLNTPIANHFNILATQTGNAPLLEAVGTDANVPIGFTTQGTGAIIFNGNTGVTCTGTPTSSFASYRGIVTHC